MTAVFHVALADDWESSLPQGAYEAATHGVPYEPGGHICATTAAGVPAVLAGAYRGLSLPLLLIRLDPDALGAVGSPVEYGPRDEEVRIRGPIPPGDDEVVLAAVPLRRGPTGWLLPPELEPSALDPSAFEPSAFDPSALDASAPSDGAPHPEGPAVAPPP